MTQDSPDAAASDLFLERKGLYFQYLSERIEHYRTILSKPDGQGGTVPLGTIPLDPRQEFLLLRELSRAGALVQEGRLAPTEPVLRFMQDAGAQARLQELAIAFAEEAMNV